jgi:hypothetical protein
MTRIYYLFLDQEFCIQNVFENLKLAILEPGIQYKEIREPLTKPSLLPPYIVIESIYKDQYLLEQITEILRDMDYDKELILLKPLVKEKTLI